LTQDGYRFVVKQRSGLRISQLQVQRLSSDNQPSAKGAVRADATDDARGAEPHPDDASGTREAIPGPDAAGKTPADEQASGEK
jgi:hypothetical protein